ncbi:hypothetical protein PVAND_000920 [Polypedilum vanderplanki]|uniref:Peptidase S1 domain-containing protein n=1 Tax=Polypedilum vanderplanki TaxID=319348 RepID=A0A9J6BLS4_POLVA|nr:hypothetical protein PVAND_000920 [Polypedilum vanderplanki]
MFLRILTLFLCFAVVLSAPQQIERKILGGEENALGEIPYVVSITIFTGLHICSGAIISDWWTITAAHCIFGRGPNTVVVRPGRIRLDVNSMEDRQGSVLITHPNYVAEILENDIGLIQVSRAFVFNVNIQPIALSDSFVGGGIAAAVSGWGTLTPGGINHNFLLTLQTSTLSNADCQSRHTSQNAALIRDDTICTNNLVGEGFCNRAFGSPLVSDSKLIAIASWNVPCALGYPDVYSRIFTSLDWIRTVTGIN